MTVNSFKAGNSREDGAAEVQLSDGSIFLISTDYLPDGLEAAFLGEHVLDKNGALTGLEEGRELSALEEEALDFAASCYKAEKAALRLIARAEQSSLGLEFKLQQRGHDGPAVKAVVSRLMDRGLLDDGRFAGLWLRSHLSYGKTQSPRWLLASLAKRGVDRDTSRKALDSLLDPDAEYALLLRYLEKTGINEGNMNSFLKAQLKNEGFSYAVLEKYSDLNDIE